MNDMEEEVRFSQLLADYWVTRGGVSALKKVHIAEVELNPFKLYKAVCKRGGAKAVTNAKLWRDIVEEAVSPSLADRFKEAKKYYMRSIYPYEKKVYFGYEEHSDGPSIIPSKVKNRNEELNKSKIPPPVQPKGYPPRENQEPPNINLLDELYKHFEKEEKEQQLYFLKKEKTEPTLQELKRVQIGMTSRIPDEVVYALNILLIYSTNSNNHLLLDEFQNIVRTLQSYLLTIYPPRNIIHTEHLRTITLIVRNFCVSTTYLQCILKTELFSTLVDLYNRSVDKECSRNVVDIMSGLVKVGWNCEVIVRQISDGIINDNMEDIEVGVDLIRGLVDEREQTLEGVIVEHLDVFAKLFVSSTPEIKETVLEILAYVSDLNSNSRTALAKHPYLLLKLIEVLSSGVQHFQKLCELSALTLSNISVSPGSKEYMRLFERDLVIIASADERIGNIAAGILAELYQD